MKAGRLRHIISIQESTPTPDGTGGFTIAWTNVSEMAEVPASVWPLKSLETLDAMKVELDNLYTIRIRYQPGITTKMRIYWVDESKTFDIISMTDKDMKHNEIEFVAKELL